MRPPRGATAHLWDLRKALVTSAPAVWPSAKPTVGAIVTASASQGSIPTSYQVESMNDIAPRTEGAAPRIGCIRRSYNDPLPWKAWNGVPQLHPGHLFNYASVSAIGDSKSMLDRSVRDSVPSSSDVGFDVAAKRAIPPRRAISQTENLDYDQLPESKTATVSGFRLRRIFNPYWIPSPKELRHLNRYESRNVERWSPEQVAVAGGTKLQPMSSVTEAQKNELGEPSRPLVTRDHETDLRRQYTLHDIPWPGRTSPDSPTKSYDVAPVHPARVYARDLKVARIKNAMRAMPDMIAKYRTAYKAAKKYSWFELSVLKLAAPSVAAKYIRERKDPK